jgi:hypothetical protein
MFASIPLNAGGRGYLNVMIAVTVLIALYALVIVIYR